MVVFGETKVVKPLSENSDSIVFVKNQKLDSRPGVEQNFCKRQFAEKDVMSYFKQNKKAKSKNLFIFCKNE